MKKAPSYFNIILFIFLNITCSHSQNPAYKLIKDSVFSIMENDYSKAKENLKQIEKNHSIDPADKITFL